MRAGSVLFFGLRPTCRITELITFLFYPVFFGTLGTAVVAGEAGVIAGVLFGMVLTWAALLMRRRGAAWARRVNKVWKEDATVRAHEKPRLTGPHNSFAHLSETFLVSMEVMIVSAISAIVIMYSYLNQRSEFAILWNFMLPYINYLFSIYDGLNSEIHEHYYSDHANRLFIIMATAFAALTACAYGCLVMSIRMMYGWREYLNLLDVVKSTINLKNESKVLSTLILFPPIIAAAVHASFFGGMEFYLIMGTIPGDFSYILYGIIKYFLALCSLPLMIFLQLSFLFPYFFIIYFYFSRVSRFRIPSSS